MIGGGAGALGGVSRGGMGVGAPALAPGIAVRPIAPHGGMIYRGTPPFQGVPLSAYPRSSQVQRAPLSEFRRMPQVRRAPLIARSDVLRRLGAHYPRYRHRHRGFAYFYGGWWYSYPWWEGYYPYGEDCEYAQRVCIANWGFQTDNYYVCMRDYGCY